MSMVYFNDYMWSQGSLGTWTDAGQARDPNPFFRKRWAVAAAFLYIWLMVGFVTGTGTLVGPAGWVTEGMQRAGFGQKAQDHAMQAVIIVWFFASAALTLWLLRQALHGSRAVRFGIPIVATLAALASLGAWMNPGRMLAAAAAGGTDAQMVATASGTRFIFGAYPDATVLRELKRQGVTAVISLQHPAVVPFEPASINAERQAAARVGIEFIHAPMLPWVSDNREALDRIRQVAREGTGVYYIHCGLGRDRTNVVRRMLEAEGVRTAAHQSIAKASTLDDRLQLPEAQRAFQRGDVRRLEAELWLVPFPNEAELAGYLEAGQVKTVVFLLNPQDEEQRAWLDQASHALATAGVNTISRPLIGRDLPTARTLAAWVRTLPKPVVVVAGRTPYANGDRYRGTEAAGAFMDAWAELVPGSLPEIDLRPHGAPARKGSEGDAARGPAGART
ncbi:MAG TPA: hypothetical protein VFS20_01920 [Longimicrobium sp.]|nr:hypothetical protein [Longimicrobium sp.]